MSPRRLWWAGRWPPGEGEAGEVELPPRRREMAASLGRRVGLALAGAAAAFGAALALWMEAWRRR